MKQEYDFSSGKRGAPVSTSRGKTRITIRIDDDILAWFRAAAHDRGGGSYQTLINAALRDHVEAGQGNLERTLRRVIREELPPGLAGQPGDTERQRAESFTANHGSSRSVILEGADITGAGCRLVPARA